MNVRKTLICMGLTRRTTSMAMRILLRHKMKRRTQVRRLTRSRQKRKEMKTTLWTKKMRRMRKKKTSSAILEVSATIIHD